MRKGSAAVAVRAAWVVLARQLSNPEWSPLSKALKAFRSMQLTGELKRHPRGNPHRQVRHLSPDQCSRLAATYVAGSTVYELAAEFGVSRKTVSRHLKAAGVSMQQSGHTPTNNEVDEMIRLYGSGRSLEAVGQRLGFVARTIERHLDARDVPRRDTHGRNVSISSESAGLV